MDAFAIFSMAIFTITFSLTSSEAIHIKANKSLLRTSEFGYAFFKSHPNSKLEVHDSLKAHAQHPKQCALGCAKNLSCLSFNFGKQPIFFYQGKAQYLCELLATDKYKSFSMFQNKNHNFNHYSIKSNCSKSPCLHNFPCVPNYTEGTYACLCPRPSFEGKHCKDVDECTTGQHNCDVNAICTNTIGSYNCTCKDGYLGNGSNCFVPTLPSDILNDYGNGDYSSALNSFMIQVSEAINNTQWTRCWSGTQDGWDVHHKFHPQCDKKGQSITIVRKERYIWGGYTDVPWTDDLPDDYHASKTSFIFSLYNIHGFNPQKFVVMDSTKAVHHDDDRGPVFGSGYDLIIGDKAASSSSSYNKPKSYEIPPGCVEKHHCNFFTGESQKYTIDDVEVFIKKMHN